MSKFTGVVAVILFFILLSFPFIYNSLTVGVLNSVSATPQPKLEKQGKCIRDTDWMRHNHMNLLKHTRENTVRNGVRVTMDSINNCRSCHSNRKEFCDSCHTYVGIKPECWNCHIYPLHGNDKIKNHG